MQDRVALITGAGSGIGKAAALRLGREGVRIGVLSRDQAEIDQTVNEVRRLGSEAIPLIADISKPEEIKAAVDKTAQQWGCLDIVFANAGINGVWASLDDLTPEDWDKTLDINLKGTFLTVKYAVPYLKMQGGSIIVTSSVNGTRKFGNTGAPAYACSKAGQVAFTKMIALELAKHRIRANVICPGAITTEIDDSTQKRNLEAIREPVEYPAGSIPLTDGKPGTAEQVAELVFFLASDASNHITGTEIWIDGGETLLQG
jgi:NAD(P)-dependent dehydrogenase (short-subunit alcohol dehydrogenase family)